MSYINPEFRYVRANHTYEVWYGTPVNQIEGRTVEEVLGISSQEVMGHLRRALAGETQNFETQFLTLQGERTVSTSHIPDVDPELGVRGVIVQANDVTAKRREKASLRQTEKLAAVGKLASSIAHEINNPLKSVANLLYLAKTSSDIKEVHEYLLTAEEELRRVSATASQTLRFHKQSTRPVSTSAETLLESVLQIYAPRLRGRIQLEQRHRPTEEILCFDGEIRQVLNNLVGNALDSMQGEGGHLLLRTKPATSWQTGDHGMAFTVCDSGTGMSASTLLTIFEAFFTTKGINGTGLGLWVSKEIMDRHSGFLRFGSAQGDKLHGTVFRVFLPYAIPPTQAKSNWSDQTAFPLKRDAVPDRTS